MLDSFVPRSIKMSININKIVKILVYNFSSKTVYFACFAVPILLSKRGIDILKIVFVYRNIGTRLYALYNPYWLQQNKIKNKQSGWHWNGYQEKIIKIEHVRVLTCNTWIETRATNRFCKQIKILKKCVTN